MILKTFSEKITKNSPANAKDKNAPKHTATLIE